MFSIRRHNSKPDRRHIPQASRWHPLGDVLATPGGDDDLLTWIRGCSLASILRHVALNSLTCLSLKDRFEFQSSCIGDTPRQAETQSLLCSSEP